jgi:hypothetical protein
MTSPSPLSRIYAERADALAAATPTATASTTTRRTTLTEPIPERRLFKCPLCMVLNYADAERCCSCGKDVRLAFSWPEPFMFLERDEE